MNNKKLDFICSYCTKIFLNPIDLPCNCNVICAEHLKDPSVLKSKSIKCNTCHNEFSTKEHNFESNKRMQALLNKNIHLSDDEKYLKTSLEESIQNFFDLLDQFNENKSVSITVGYNHFQQIRLKIDLQREELKDQVDKIYFDMIDKTKAMERSYMSQFEKLIYNNLSESQSELTKNLNETFRSANICLDSLKQMLDQRNEAICELKSNLTQLNQIEEHLIKSNKFEPNLKFSQDSFGSLSLMGHSYDPFKSQILTGAQPAELIELCEFAPKEKWRLLYRASQDGFGAKEFHSKCDGKSSTLTIAKVKHGSNIFGAYTNVSWESAHKWKHDSSAFIFSLTNKDNAPCKIKTKDGAYSIGCSSSCGPTFGFGIDLCIANNANLTKSSYSDLGLTYRHPVYDYKSDESKSFLAGSEYFQLSEIEVYQKE